jgi:hypothetical protein
MKKNTQYYNRKKDKAIREQEKKKLELAKLHHSIEIAHLETIEACLKKAEEEHIQIRAKQENFSLEIAEFKKEAIKQERQIIPVNDSNDNTEISYFFEDYVIPTLGVIIVFLIILFAILIRIGYFDNIGRNKKYYQATETFFSYIRQDNKIKLDDTKIVYNFLYKIKIEEQEIVNVNLTEIKQINRVLFKYKISMNDFVLNNLIRIEIYEEEYDEYLYTNQNEHFFIIIENIFHMIDLDWEDYIIIVWDEYKC